MRPHRENGAIYTALILLRRMRTGRSSGKGRVREGIEMARTFRRCTNRKSDKPVPLPRKAFPEKGWLFDSRKTIMADNPWRRRFYCTDVIKSRTKRRRRMKERFLNKANEPELLILPEKDRRLFSGDRVY